MGDTLLLHLFEMSVEVRGLHVRNPAGFESENLLYAKKLLVDVHGWEFFRSFGKSIVIENLHFLNVHMNVEKPGEKSNLAVVMDYIDEHKDTEKDSDDKKKVELQNVQLKDIDISYSSSMISCEVVLEDVSYENFTKDVGVDAVVSMLMGTIGKTVAANLAKKALVVGDFLRRVSSQEGS